MKKITIVNRFSGNRIIKISVDIVILKVQCCSQYPSLLTEKVIISTGLNLTKTG